MVTVILLLYIGCVIAAFRYIKIKINPKSVAISLLIGVFLIGGIVVTWKLVAPISEQVTLRRVVVRIVPNVREFVTKVFVESNQLVKKGEPLFEVSKERFQYAVAQARGSLKAAESKYKQLESSVDAAKASVNKSAADLQVAQVEIDTADKLKRSSPGAVAKLRIEEAQASYLGAQATYNASKASLQQAQSSLAAAQYSIEMSQAALSNAEYQLSQTTYRSGVDGRVINFQIREGTMVARWQFTTVGSIMDLSDNAILAIYPQNLLKNVAPGDKVEIAFRRQPGMIATGKVDTVIKYTGEGQFAASEAIPVVATVGSKGFLAVRIYLDDEELARNLPLGAAGTTAIYTGVGKAFHVISKITVRIKSWLYYIPV